MMLKTVTFGDLHHSCHLSCSECVKHQLICCYVGGTVREWLALEASSEIIIRSILSSVKM